MVCQFDCRETACIGPRRRSKDDHVPTGRPYLLPLLKTGKAAAVEQTAPTEQEAVQALRHTSAHRTMSPRSSLQELLWQLPRRDR